MNSHNKEVKKAYQEILDVCKKHKKISENQYMGDIKIMLNSAKNHLSIIEWKEKYGIDIPHSKQINGTYVELDEFICLSYYEDGEKDKENGYGKYVSWSVDGRQPKEEWLLVISFSTGAYIFGSDYEGQKQLFIDFFDELKSYNPTYTDDANSSLYWNIEKASNIYNDFHSILDKFRARNKAEFKTREIGRMKRELEKLQS